VPITPAPTVCIACVGGCGAGGGAGHTAVGGAACLYTGSCPACGVVYGGQAWDARAPLVEVVAEQHERADANGGGARRTRHPGCGAQVGAHEPQKALLPREQLRTGGGRVGTAELAEAELEAAAHLGKCSRSKQAVSSEW